MKRLPVAARRARRGAPDDTRATLITAAARLFNRDGYHGTDSNAIARAAGYAPGTFYRHFVDKRAIFLAVYERWVESEWAEIGARARAGQLDAGALVDFVVAHHRDWRGFRASLRALLATDPKVRRFFRARRRRQVELMGELAVAAGGTAPPVEDRAMLLLTLERVADAISDREVEDLGADPAEIIMRLKTRVADYLSSVTSTASSL